MLKRIKKIKGFGVFDNYTAPKTLGEFGKYNVIYGENGSGKTTLSRLLGNLEAGDHPEHPELEYQIETDTGEISKGVPYARKIRVFNSDYVEANIGRLEGPLKHILVVGAQNKELAAALDKERNILAQRREEIKKLYSNIDSLNEEKSKIFSDIAKTISEAISGAVLRSYRKPEAESAYAKLTSSRILEQTELERYRATIRQEILPSVGEVSAPKISIEGKQKSAAAYAEEAATHARALTRRSVEAVLVERLAINPDIASWVEAGIRVHAKHNSERCEYCDQPIPEARLKALAAHFNDADQQLKEEIEAEREHIQAALKALRSHAFRDKAALYSELREEWEAGTKDFEQGVEELEADLRAIDNILADKLTQRTKAYDVEITCRIDRCADALARLSDIARRHNDKTEDFDQAQAKAREAIEAHYLSSIRDRVEKCEKHIRDLEEQITELETGKGAPDDPRSLDEIERSIAEKQAALSDAHAGGAELTKRLAQFLGRTDLRFESTDEGYHVLRRGKPAKRLSEGERTAIAFLYFLVQLQDNNFNIHNGIVVIDDPISSLDASSIYQAFSFLKNETQDAHQLFILTHNFEFLRLVINWINHFPKNMRSYFMVICAETTSGRSAKLEKLDDLLISHPTEYHYLFKLLLTFKSDGTIASCYHIPNAARKVLETFLEFHSSLKGTLYKKLESINFDKHKKTSIYKFTNDLFHTTGKSFDPAIVSETQKNVNYLLEMIQSIAPLHYDSMKQQVTS